MHDLTGKIEARRWHAPPIVDDASNIPSPRNRFLPTELKAGPQQTPNTGHPRPGPVLAVSPRITWGSWALPPSSGT